MTIFFARNPLIIIILFTSLILLIITTRELCQINRGRINQYVLISIGAVIIFVATFHYQKNLADQIFYLIREDKLNTLVKEIRNYDKITSMSNGLRSLKDLNGRRIEYDPVLVDTITKSFIKRYFFDDVLKEENIDKER